MQKKNERNVAVQWMKQALTTELEGRKKVLMLAYLAELDYSLTNQLLNELGYVPLYVRREQDAAWMFLLMRGMEGEEVIEMVKNKKLLVEG